MKFGNDGMLYVTTGDGGRVSNGQLKSNNLASLLRLTDDGRTPEDNPFTAANGYTSFHCSDTGGWIPIDAPSDAVCSEIFAYGLRNPFRMSLDPSEKKKTVFAISDVGARTWEELNYGGSDYVGANYGFGVYEGPCRRGNKTVCFLDEGFVEPFHYYQHRAGGDGCVAGSVFVPEGLWPDEYKFLFIDFTWNDIYNLIKSETRECRECLPPISTFVNETFYHSIWYPGNNKNEARMLDLFFGPYKDTQALYVIRYGNYDTILRITYTGIHNDPPFVDFDFERRNYDVDEEVFFIGNLTTDTEGDALTFNWFFGDGAESSETNPSHAYARPGEYKVTLIVVDALNQAQQKSESITVGTPPTATILLPVDGSQYHVGQVLLVKGEAFLEDGTPMDDSQLEWEVRKHHDDHFHPFFGSEGNNLELPPAPGPEDFFASTNSYLEIILRATDEFGLTTEVSTVADPILVTVNIRSEPQGRVILVDGEPIETNQDITSWQEHEIHLTAQQDTTYSFVSWSDGEMARERYTKLNGSGNHTFTALFCVQDGYDCSDESAICCSGLCQAGMCLAPPTVSPFPSSAPTNTTEPTISPSQGPSEEPSQNPSHVPSEVPDPAPDADFDVPPIIWGALDYYSALELTPDESFGDCLGRNDGVDAQPTTDSICRDRDGSACNIGWWDAGEHLQYRFTIPADGKGLYDMRARVASPRSGRHLGMELLKIDGSPWESFSSFDVPSAGWQSFDDLFWYAVDLDPGNYILIVSSTSGRLNLCSVAVLPTADEEPDSDYKIAVPGVYSAMYYADPIIDNTLDNLGNCPYQKESPVDAKLVNDAICKQAATEHSQHCNIAFTQANEYVFYNIRNPQQQSTLNVSLRAASYNPKDVRIELFSAEDMSLLASAVIRTFGGKDWNDYHTIPVWDSVNINSAEILKMKVTFVNGAVNLCSIGVE